MARDPKGTGDIQELLHIMARLRDPEAGCPWDVKQSFHSIAPYTIEEAYEVADAIESEDFLELKDELGDLLLQVVFHARMAEEQEIFAFRDIVMAICEKMTRRHPHVFGDTRVEDEAEQRRAWETHKEKERCARGSKSDAPPSALSGVSVALPGLTRAVKLQKRAARVGFDWANAVPVFAKVREELVELEEVAAQDEGQDRAEEELGDLLFVCANLARHFKVDPEAALRRANAKFERRFRYVEEALRERGDDLAGATLEEMDGLWEECKSRE